MRLYIYRMTTGPMKGIAFCFRADTPEEAATKAEAEAAKLKGRYKLTKAI